MEDKLIEVLSTFGYDVHRQGSLASENDYPDSFFTFWNNNSEDGNHYDNQAISCIWDFDVNFYGKDVVLVYKTIDGAINLLKQNGFIISGRGYDVPSGKQSHIGRGVNALFIEEMERKG